ncbi:MAG: putative lipid II flippase FtsW [Clostridia bacterium]
MNFVKIHNKPLVFATLTLALFGILMQYCASSYFALKETGDAFFYAKKQSLALVVALVAFVAVQWLNVDKLKKYKWWIVGFSCLILTFVFIPGFGVEKYGAKRWINLGFTTLQPSEISKFGLIIFIAGVLSERSSNKFKTMIPIFCATATMCALIMLQPNMSITMCIGIVCMIMLFVGGTTLKQFAVMALPLVALVVALILLEPYRLKRLMAFVDPWASPLGEGYQLIQSYYALGAGGLFGVGLFNSRQKYLFLPFAESDFILAIIGEELGLFGCLFVVILFLVIVWQGGKIALRASTRMQAYTACGIVSIIAVQALLNIAVVSGAIPPTGLPLPFVSAGGSSLVVFVSGVGILENICAHSQQNIIAHNM